MVALRDKGLRELASDPDLTVLRLLCDRRDELSRAPGAGPEPDAPGARPATHGRADGSWSAPGWPPAVTRLPG